MHSTQKGDNALVAQYFARGGVVTVCKTKRAKGISYFALTIKGSKHRGKLTYGRGNKRMAA